jgi:type IV secretory pathway VirB2 component (pilin)
MLKNILNNKETLNNVAFITMFAFVLMLVPDMGFAADTQQNPIAATLCNIVGILSGTVAKAVGTIAIIFLALGLFVGKVSWGTAVATGIGIGAIFGAQTIVNLISGRTDAKCDGGQQIGFLVEQLSIYLA